MDLIDALGPLSETFDAARVRSVAHALSRLPNDDRKRGCRELLALAASLQRTGGSRHRRAIEQLLGAVAPALGETTRATDSFARAAPRRCHHFATSRR